MIVSEKINFERSGDPIRTMGVGRQILDNKILQDTYYSNNFEHVSEIVWEPKDSDEELGNNIARNNDVESYHWDNPDWNEMQIWINREMNN
jgi:hypothetical protein